MEQLDQLFVEAGTLMLAGMVFVFIFLGFLVAIINLFLAPLAEKFPDVVSSSPTRPTLNNKSADKGISPSVVAAISAAVSQYRQQHKKQ